MQTDMFAIITVTLFWMFGFKEVKLKVLDIIKNVLTFINKSELYDEIANNGFNTTNNEAKQLLTLLLECINSTNNLIASEYYYLKQTVQINSTGKVDYKNLSSNAICDILNVEHCGKSVNFKTYPGYLLAPNGLLNITFSYLPKQILNPLDVVNDYPLKLNDRVFSYGVASEYYFICGLYDDATVWDNRFKNSLKNVLRPKHEIKIKNRLWI